MNQQDAIDLLRAAILSADGETWADLGAGDGTFTRALATLVGADGRVVAIDRDARGLAAIRALAARRGHDDDASGATIVTVQADVSAALDLPPLDGVVMANVLHFIADAEGALRRIVSHLRPGGRLVLIEYEGRRPSAWVPFPVSITRFEKLAAAVGLTAPRIAATRPSTYGGEMYVAVAERRA